MKKLSIEEKAQRYDEAIERAKSELNSPDKRLIEYIFPELKESEDERIRKEIVNFICWATDRGSITSEQREKSNSWLAWLEKQGEHAKFRDFIQVGDKVTRNEDGVLVNLSQLKRVAKPVEPMIVGQEPLYDYTNANICQKDFAEQKPAWSEEDDKMFNSALWHVKNSCGNGGKNSGEFEVYCWLKSLKERYTWKPSDEQMNALNYVVNLMASSERPTENDLYYNILKSLRQQLMKLKDEK